MVNVYLLKSQKDNKYYIGQTENTERRFQEHNDGKNQSTRNRTPFAMIGYEIYTERNIARYRERELKKYPRRKKKFIEKLEKEYAEKNKKNY